MKAFFGFYFLAAFAFFACTCPAAADTSVVKVARTADGFQLLRNGKPYYIRGAGGDGSKAALQAAGGNSWRTWNANALESALADAQKLGMTVTVGLWLPHKGSGFRYDDPLSVAKQKEKARRTVLRYRRSPALLAWALGNEMETGQEDDPALWKTIEDIAKMAHALDPDHPTMTVIADLGIDKISRINSLCPDIDIVGLNTYAGGPTIGERYKAAGGVKPYVVTEYGPPGAWESPKNNWGAAPELTSTQKAGCYRDTYERSVLGRPLCLGSYAFDWGSKQEATATWFGLLLPGGSRLGAVDTLTQLWTGHPPARLCPVIRSLTVGGDGQAAPGAVLHAFLDAASPQHDPLSVRWVLQADPEAYSVGGKGQAAPTIYPHAILFGSTASATVKMPLALGAYRLYAYVYDRYGGAATANVSLCVRVS